MARLLQLPLSVRSLHICVDMQRLFTSEGPWPTPPLTGMVAAVCEIAGRFPERTIFTRFVPPAAPTDLPGAWQRYYRRWEHVTREHLDTELLELVPELVSLSPPAGTWDKMVYSPFTGSSFARRLRARGADTLIITGAETDVCVLATVMGAIDYGFRVVIAVDAICSSSSIGHDAILTLYRERFAEQIEVATVESILSSWPT